MNVENKDTLREAKAIKPLVNLLRRGGPDAKQSVTEALWHLIQNEANIDPIIEAGAIGPLSDLLLHAETLPKEQVRQVRETLRVLGEGASFPYTFCAGLVVMVLLVFSCSSERRWDLMVSFVFGPRRAVQTKGERNAVRQKERRVNGRSQTKGELQATLRAAQRVAQKEKKKVAQNEVQTPSAAEQKKAAQKKAAQKKAAKQQRAEKELLQQQTEARAAAAKRAEKKRLKDQATLARRLEKEAKAAAARTAEQRRVQQQAEQRVAAQTTSVGDVEEVDREIPHAAKCDRAAPLAARTSSQESWSSVLDEAQATQTEADTKKSDDPMHSLKQLEDARAAVEALEAEKQRHVKEAAAAEDARWRVETELAAARARAAVEAQIADAVRIVKETAEASMLVQRIVGDTPKAVPQRGNGRGDFPAPSEGVVAGGGGGASHSASPSLLSSAMGAVGGAHESALERSSSKVPSKMNQTSGNPSSGSGGTSHTTHTTHQPVSVTTSANNCNWTCPCGWDNRARNNQCGGGNPGYGCGQTKGDGGASPGRFPHAGANKDNDNNDDNNDDYDNYNDDDDDENDADYDDGYANSMIVINALIAMAQEHHEKGPGGTREPGGAGVVVEGAAGVVVKFTGCQLGQKLRGMLEQDVLQRFMKQSSVFKKNKVAKKKGRSKREVQTKGSLMGSLKLALATHPVVPGGIIRIEKDSPPEKSSTSAKAKGSPVVTVSIELKGRKTPWPPTKQTDPSQDTAQDTAAARGKEAARHSDLKRRQEETKANMAAQMADLQRQEEEMAAQMAELRLQEEEVAAMAASMAAVPFPPLPVFPPPLGAVDGGLAGGAAGGMASGAVGTLPTTGVSDTQVSVASVVYPRSRMAQDATAIATDAEEAGVVEEKKGGIGDDAATLDFLSSFKARGQRKDSRERDGSDGTSQSWEESLLSISSAF